MKKIFLIVIIISFVSINNYSQQNDYVLSLDKAVSLTLQNYPLIKEAQQRADVYNSILKEQKSYYYPNVSAEAAYSRIGPVPAFDLPGMGSFELFPENNYDAHISVDHNLYDFGKKDAQIDLTESIKKSATDNIELVKSKLAYATVQTYYSIIFIEKSIAINDTNVATLNEHINITNKKIESGTATDYDLLGTKVNLTKLDSRKIDLQNELKKQKIILQHLTGLNAEEINVSRSLILHTTDVNSDSLINVAYQQRAEVKLANDEEQSSHLKESLVSYNDLPQLNLHLSYGVKNGYIPNLDIWRGNWVAGFNLSVPIFNGFRKDYQEEEAKTGTAISESKTENIKQQIKEEVNTAVSDIDANLKQLQTEAVQVKYAEQLLEKAKVQYTLGVGTNLDLLDAETRLAEARFSYLKAIYYNILNGYELKKAVGDVIWK